MFGATEWDVATDRTINLESENRNNCRDFLFSLISLLVHNMNGFTSHRKRHCSLNVRMPATALFFMEFQLIADMYGQ